MNARTSAEVAELDFELQTIEYARNPHPTNHRLRAIDPIHWSEARQAWIPTRYADVKYILDHPQDFSSMDVTRPRIELLMREVPDPERSRMLEFWKFRGLFQSDPPDYRRYRTVVMKALVDSWVGIQDRVQRLVDQLIDEVIEIGEIDVIRDLAYPLPATVIFDLLGVDPDDRAAFRVWAESLALAVSDQSGRAAIEASRSLEEGYQWLRGVVRDRRSYPREDVISTVVNADIAQSMDEPDVFSTFVFLLLAGHETTANLIGNGLGALLNNPVQLEALRANPSLMPKAIEEFLRHESPIQVTARRVVARTELDGCVMSPGQLIVVMHGAANRDPAQFRDPDRCDIRRDSSGHLAFGHGVHFCLGAPLARIEGPIAIATILRRLSDIEVAGPTRWRANSTFRGLESLPLRFKPLRRPA